MPWGALSSVHREETLIVTIANYRHSAPFARWHQMVAASIGQTTGTMAHDYHVHVASAVCALRVRRGEAGIYGNA